MIKFTIIIPAFNEEGTIEQVINTIPDVPGVVKNILVVDDGSDDNTLSHAQRSGASWLSNETNLGLGGAFKLGLSHAIKENSDIIAILDADGQYESYGITQLIRPILEANYDLVIGNRFIYQGSFESSMIRRLGNIFISTFISKLLLRLDLSYDIQSSYRAFSRKLAIYINNNIKAKYNYAQEMFILASLNNFKIKQIPVKCKKRKSGKSKLIRNPFIHLIRVLWISFKTCIENKS